MHAQSLQSCLTLCDPMCSVAQLCPTHYDPMDCSMPGFPVLHHLLELAQTYAHWFNDAIQSSHPLSSSSPLAFYLFQHQGPMSQLFTSGGKSIGSSVSASGLQMNIQGYFSLGLISLNSLQSQGLSRVFFNTTVQSHQFHTLPSLWSNSHIYTCLLKTPSVSSVSSVT